MTRTRFHHPFVIALLLIIPSACADALNELENPASPPDASVAPDPDEDAGADDSDAG